MHELIFLFPSLISVIVHVTVVALLSTDPANITESPADLTVNQSFSAELSCTAFGNPIPQIVWSRDEDSDLSDNENDTISVFTMINDAQYTITSILLINFTMRSRDAGMYNCTAVNNISNNINADNIQIAELIVQGKLFGVMLTCSHCFFLQFSTSTGSTNELFCYWSGRRRSCVNI